MKVGARSYDQLRNPAVRSGLPDLPDLAHERRARSSRRITGVGDIGANAAMDCASITAARNTNKNLDIRHLSHKVHVRRDKYT